MRLVVVEWIWDFLKQTINNGLTPDVIFYLGIGFVGLMVLFFAIKTYFSYERKLDRHLEKFNRWLYVHQNISENNLIEFNNMMRKAPKLLRYHWQQYILYRENSPSHYMSAYNCIEKPLHTSSYTANIKNFTMITVVGSIVAFLMSLLNYVGSSLSVTNITTSLIAPIIMLIFGTIFIMVLRVKQGLDLSSLYQNFHLFTRSIDKAATSIPKYVDFEVLFTPKEIKNGIPILGEYLEKRARQEAEELEQARLNAGKIEEYDFSSSGIDGSVMLDRAMKETEIYLNAKSRLYAEIQQYETEIRSLEKNYENVTRDYQKKLQASKESLERLRIQQEESTNRIESNYIVKQQQNEIKKQEQLEKDQEDATTRYNQEVRVNKEEIVKRQDELAEKKNNIQNVMLSEYQTFSNKVYQTVLNDIKDDANNKLQELARQKENVEKDLATQKEISDIKDQVIDELKQALAKVKSEETTQTEQLVVDNVEQDNADNLATKEQQDIEQPTEVEQSTDASTDSQENAEGHYDENGYYWYPNGTYYDDKGLYHDENGNIYDSEGNLIELAQSQPEEVPQENEVSEIQSNEAEPAEINEQPEQELPAIEPVEEKSELVQDNVAENVAQEPDTNNQEQKPEQTENAVEEKPSEEHQTDAKEATVTPPVEAEDKPKRKAGRPRKVVTEKEEKPKRKAGRPKKVKPSDGEEEQKPKRKAGRPRKEKPAEDENKPKRSVGRPKKVKEETEDKPKRKVGRPKKEKTEVEQKPKRKVGRPKKSNEEKLNDQINEESQRLEQEERDLLKTLGSTLKKLADNSEPNNN